MKNQREHWNKAQETLNMMVEARLNMLRDDSAVQLSPTKRDFLWIGHKTTVYFVDNLFYVDGADRRGLKDCRDPAARIEEPLERLWDEARLIFGEVAETGLDHALPLVPHSANSSGTESGMDPMSQQLHLPRRLKPPAKPTEPLRAGCESN
jgi:hypothetical protein